MEYFGARGDAMMVEFYIKEGPYLLSGGSLQAEMLEYVEVPLGAELVQAPVPLEALAPPPAPGARWNLDTRQWDVPTPTTEELWGRVRYQRDALLAACDWVVVKAREVGEEVPPPWREYRQALRDITEQPDPAAIVWPVAPG